MAWSDPRLTKAMTVPLTPDALSAFFVIFGFMSLRVEQPHW